MFQKVVQRHVQGVVGQLMTIL